MSSTLPSPTMDLVLQFTVPVKVGLAKGALLSRAPCVALEIGLIASEVLSTLLTLDLVMPSTVPIKVGLASGALLSRAPCVALEIGCSSQRCYRRCQDQP